MLRNKFPGLTERLETQEDRREAVTNPATAEFRTDSGSQYD
jgi:hypothetical protein